MKWTIVLLFIGFTACSDLDEASQVSSVDTDLDVAIEVPTFGSMAICKLVLSILGGECVRFDDGSVEGIYDLNADTLQQSVCINVPQPPGDPNAKVIEVANEDATNEIVVGDGSCQSGHLDDEDTVRAGHDMMLPHPADCFWLTAAIAQPQQCPPNMHFSSCHSECPDSCMRLSEFCTMHCVAGCTCNERFVLDSTNNCIPPGQCP